MTKDVRVQRNIRVTIDQRALWMGIRRALLVAVAEIENFYGVSPTTSEIRDVWRKRSENSNVD